jgi:hypothetical protein
MRQRQLYVVLEAEVLRQAGMLFVNWTEASRNVSGGLNSKVSGDRVIASAESGFPAGPALVASGDRQSVSIVSEAGI